MPKRRFAKYQGVIDFDVLTITALVYRDNVFLVCRNGGCIHRNQR